MRRRKYFSYFLFLWRKFDLRLARHVIRLEIAGERKYAIDTSGSDSLKTLRNRGVDLRHSAIYMPASYDLLEDVFTFLAPENLRHLVDVGCGKGRVLSVAAHFGFRNLTGVELSKKLALKAVLNIEKTQRKIRNIKFRIVQNDAFYFEMPQKVDCIFLFNPFDEVILSGMIDNMSARLRDRRKLFVVYFNPVFKELFLNLGFREIRHRKKSEFLDYSVMMK